MRFCLLLAILLALPTAWTGCGARTGADTDDRLPGSDASVRPATDAAPGDAFVSTPDASTRDAAEPEDDAGAAGCANDTIDGWIHCGGDRFGQTASTAGVTCTQVCAAAGRECIHRAAQSDYDACAMPGSMRSGTCEDVFAPSWSSACLCAPCPP